MSYKCQYFKIEELVDEATYLRYGEKAWQFLDDRLLKLADFLRSKFGSCIVNDWVWGGNYSESGLRSPDTSTGAMYSQHKFGRALDMKFKEHKAQTIREWLEINWTEDLSKAVLGEVVKITVETDITWLHIDIRNNHKIFNKFKP